ASALAPQDQTTTTCPVFLTIRFGASTTTLQRTLCETHWAMIWRDLLARRRKEEKFLSLGVRPRFAVWQLPMGPLEKPHRLRQKNTSPKLNTFKKREPFPEAYLPRR